MNKKKLVNRQAIIQLHKKGKKQTEISYLLDVPQTTVSYCIRKFKLTGNIEDKPRSGKPAKLNKMQLSELKKILLDFPPSRYGGESIGWLTKIAIQYVYDTYGVQYSMRRMQELFHKFGLNLITPRTEHKNASYAARTVYRMDFKKNSKMNIWIAPSLISTK
ncbi:MAG: winged helix-turn-helix domain-containing protein [Nanoarchaeota archaeon]|nr:winged helix-turn-helix domain-containing protein [Nanoarchaeota archaeon]